MAFMVWCEEKAVFSSIMRALAGEEAEIGFLGKAQTNLDAAAQVAQREA
jgi:hypothetical protein